MRYLVSRLSFPGTPVPVAVAPSLEAADEMIAKLDAAEPKGTIVIYSREPMGEATPKDFRVVKTASALAAWAD